MSFSSSLRDHADVIRRPRCVSYLHMLSFQVLPSLDREPFLESENSLKHPVRAIIAVSLKSNSIPCTHLAYPQSLSELMCVHMCCVAETHSMLGLGEGDTGDFHPRRVLHSVGWSEVHERFDEGSLSQTVNE